VKIRFDHLFLVLILAALAAVVSGCASTESDNASVRPWNSPEGWQGGALGDMIDQQHR
jgi:hypothetical protein